MKKIKLILMVGVVAFSLQACSNNTNKEETMDSTDSIYKENEDMNNRNTTPMLDDSTSSIPPDTTAGRNINRTDDSETLAQ